MYIPTKRQVLVVDSEPSVQEGLALVLTSSGYEVYTESGGFAALSRLRGMLPDLLITELNMPDMSGYELLSVVRRRFPEILTVAIGDVPVQAGLPPGVIADGYFFKTQDTSVLLRQIAEMIESSETWANDHQKSIAPAWIPRNGHDPHGIPYVVVSCEECLRTFHLVIEEETAGAVLVAPCRYCPSKNRYIIEPLPQMMQPA